MPEFVKPTVDLMVDNGSSICLMKIEAHNPDIDINYHEKGKLLGITSEIIDTLGVVHLAINNITTPFCVVKNDFPICAKALLGRDLLKKIKATLSYYSNTLTLE